MCYTKGKGCYFFVIQLQLQYTDKTSFKVSVAFFLQLMASTCSGNTAHTLSLCKPFKHLLDYGTFNI